MRSANRHETREPTPPPAADAGPPASNTEGNDQQGQSLVEFALILPLFFLLVAGMFDFGLGIYSDLTLVNASREGARLGVIDPGNTAAIESRVRAMAGNLDGSRMNVTIKCERPTGTTFSSCSKPMWQPGDATTVTVDYKYPMFFPLLFGTEIPLSSETRMRIE